MTTKRKIFAAAALWIAAITGAHLALNVNWPSLLNEWMPGRERKLNVAYIPVT